MKLCIFFCKIHIITKYAKRYLLLFVFILISIFHEVCIDAYLRNINYFKTVTKKHANSKSPEPCNIITNKRFSFFIV